MKIIEISDNTYKVLEEIANHWNKECEKWKKEDPDFHYEADWDPNAVLYTLTMMTYREIKNEKHENNINQNE